MLKKPQLHADFDHQKFEKFLNPDKTRYNNLDLSRETKVEDPFQDLPDEILLNIFSHLSPYHLAMCSFVNLQFNDISQDWLLWKDFFESNLNLLDFEDLASHYQNKYKITKPLGFFPEKETQNHLTNPNYIPNGNNNNTNTNNNNTNNNTNNINNKISQVSKEKEKEKEKEKQLKKRLTEEPLKFFIEQVHKYQNVKLIYERSDALIKRRTKINNFSRKMDISKYHI
ncbi:dactylin [Anaeramoeba flamelloides]|uniref:Dactylin n=1 Tax=Anaeramoeba flamelloides TaxID=1746091 RepID=A0ABQ8YZA7_9EUKA|nr:dactylin [Anaeramoeba flamelloides]